MEDLGIYTNIRESGNKSPWDGKHKMYYADCKICGQTVERTLYDLRKFNTVCKHCNNLIKDNKCYLPDNLSKTDYYQRVYNLWRSMILRTTEKFWEKYPTYKGTTVSDEWRNFINFYEDIKTLDGYDMWLNGKGTGVMLDKDVLGKGKKLYSKETCCFLSHADSNRDVLNRHPEMIEKLVTASRKKSKETGRNIKAINKKTNEIKFFNSIKECARTLNILPANIWMCLSTDEKYISYKSAKGWIFEDI